ncbi:hypothetical protein Goshw_007519, partial [Gossypium schwendimanii]|nr:hypothetical protein [Gossypium schwendimanii]
IKVFSWRLGHGLLPTYDNIAHIRQKFSNTYHRCNNSEVTVIYVMKDCPVSREILTLGGLNNKLLEGNYDHCIDWLGNGLRVLDAKAAADFFTLFWDIWNNRNSLVFNGNRDAAGKVWKKVKSLSDDFKICNITYPLVIPLILANKKWMKPPISYVKINFDADISNSGVGYGVIAKDSDGIVIGGCYGFKHKQLDVNWAKMEAFVESLKLTATLTVPSTIFESYSSNLVNKFNN